MDLKDKVDRYSKYSIKPFSRPAKATAQQQVCRSDESTCAICCRVVKEPRKHAAVVMFESFRLEDNVGDVGIGS